MAGAIRNRPGLAVTFTLKWTGWAASSGAPAEMLAAQVGTVWAGAFVATPRPGATVKLGAALTGVTLMSNVCGALVSDPPLAEPPSSLATTVTVAVPLALGAVW